MSEWNRVASSRVTGAFAYDAFPGEIFDGCFVVNIGADAITCCVLWVFLAGAF